ncbi:hypothetical protein GBF38_018339 [Nibea albiflora]|uniref:Uncharacterized protein n=1 Tax=Nibea albiflora TaxID=240163 RepID=A0ACB7ENB0_NIBAL|nr:hypothetical protein GBF38_018339 [Nibea albiflora]
MDCFTSADPNVTLLYDNNNDNENLWMRNDTAARLEPCFPLRPWQFPCSVCIHDGKVYAMCKKLADSVRLMMEAIEKPVRVSKSDAQQPWIIVAAPLIVIVIVIVMAVLLYCKNQQQARNNNNPEKAMLSVTPAEENHTVLSCCADGINDGP